MFNTSSGRDEIDLWSTETWQQDVLAWIDTRLLERGIQRTAELTHLRIRTWSTVFRFPTDRGIFWFQANSPLSIHETSLYPLLVQVAPQTVLSPLAIDTIRGWLIVPDGGITLMHAASGDQRYETLAALIPEYAKLQIGMIQHLPLLLQFRVPDMRATIMPLRYDEALVSARSLLISPPTDDDITLLDEVAALRPDYLDICERLSKSKVPSSLDHGDLHANNILPSVNGTPRIYDWGDSSIAHPFATMLVFLRNAATALETGHDDPRLMLLRDAYLNVFREWGSPSTLIDTLELACRAAMVSRATTWIRTLDLGPMPDASWHTAPVEWLGSLRSHSYLGDHIIT